MGLLGRLRSGRPAPAASRLGSGQQAKAKVGALISTPDKLQPMLNKLLPVLSGIFILGVIAALGRART